MKPAELSIRIETSTAVLANWRYLGIGPKFIKLGRSIRYRVTDVEAWLDAQTRQQTGAA
ncbi:DNA-binding protein [Arthrobacter sp. ISL-85]|nr:DNA-binding protein [Arthrobacter sp. ISL-85]